MKFLITFLICAFAGLPAAAAGDTVFAARTIRSQTILTAADVRLQIAPTPGAFNSIQDVVGLETRVVIYQGREISPQDVGAATIIQRNQIVSLVYLNGGLSIATDARALGRAGIGDRLRVMNLTSRKTVIGVVDRFGSVIVGRASAFFR